MEKEIKVKKKVETKDETKEVDKVAMEIAEKISSLLEKKESKKAKVTKEKLAKVAKVQTVDKEVTLYKAFDRTTGGTKELKMKESEMTMCADWFRALVHKDKKTMNEIVTKLGPLVESTAARGGNLVPVILADFLTEIIQDQAVIRPRANVIDMSGRQTCPVA